MIEILTIGNVEKEFNKLGVEFKQTYKGEKYGVCEVTEDEFKILCDDAEKDDEEWGDGGWRCCEGSNQGKPNQTVLIMNKEIVAWYDNTNDFDSEEEKQYYLEEHKGIMPLEKYNDLLQYLCDEMGCSQPKNVCALTKDLAKYNNMKLSELFKKYQR